MRGELVDRFETVEDEGRPLEVQTGGVVGVEPSRVLVQGLAGWSWPRGPLPPGPAALASASISF